EIAGSEFSGGDILRKPARGAHDLILAAIVEGDGEVELVVVLGPNFGAFDNLGDIVLKAFAAADDAHADAFTHELIEITIDVETQQIEERIHLLGGTAPVFGREAENRK